MLLSSTLPLTGEVPAGGRGLSLFIIYLFLLFFKTPLPEASPLLGEKLNTIIFNSSPNRVTSHRGKGSALVISLNKATEKETKNP
jgi:hypothetical protein